MADDTAKNVFGKSLEQLSTSPMTGFYRDGYCKTSEDDAGSHVIGAIVTQEFLDFTKSKGNDLQTPNPLYRFPGLKAGDKWCLCALRWKEAHEAGFAPPINLEATHKKSLKYIPIETLQKFKEKK